MTQRPARCWIRVNFEADQLGAAQPARDQKRQDGAVRLALERGGVGRIPKLVRLLSTCTQLVDSRSCIFNDMHAA
jgi:hypothetical protein